MTTEVKFHFHHIVPRALAVNIPVDMDIYNLTAIMLVRFLLTKNKKKLSSASHTGVSGRKSLWSWPLRRRELCPSPQGQSSYVNYLESFCVRDSSLSSHLFIYLFHRLFLWLWTHASFCSTWGYNLRLGYLFSCSNCFNSHTGVSVITNLFSSNSASTLLSE